jgi:DNA-binding PadR family transcriptional regulator
MSLKHAILGFLSFKSFSGYDLKKAFDQSVQHFWPANQSQIYRTLAQMTADEFVKQEVIEREDRLDKKLYHITPTGEVELHNWLTTPKPTPDTREPFLIQVYFGGKIPDQEIIKLFQHEIQSLEERLATFQVIYHTYREMISTHSEPRAFFFSVLTMEYGIAQGKASLNWLKNALERIESDELSLHPFDQIGVK